MSNIVITPSIIRFISDKNPERNYPDKGSYFIGLDYDGSIYRSLVHFDLDVLPEDIEIESAYINLFTKNKRREGGATLITPYLISSNWHENEVNWNNQPNLDTSVKGNTVEVNGDGWCKWDITKVVDVWIRKNTDNFGILFKTAEKECSGIRRFFPVNNLNTKEFNPFINIQYRHKDEVSQNSRRTVSLFEQHKTSDSLKYSKWFDSSDLSTYSFFIENVGERPAEVFIQLSPDRNTIYNEKNIFTIQTNSSKVILPLEYSFFCRLAFKSSFHESNTILKMWFQAHV